MNYPELLQAFGAEALDGIIEPETRFAPLPRSGSDRIYHRATGADGSRSVIVTANADVAENGAFMAVGDALRQCGVNVPRVLAVSADGSMYIQEDLGSTSLLSFIRGHGAESPEAQSLLRRTMQMLAVANIRAPRFLEAGRLHPVRSLTARAIGWDLNYFKYCFLKAMGIPVQEGPLEDDFELLTRRLLQAMERQREQAGGAPVLMLRDFQSRNVMVHRGEPYFIDFQGAREGLWAYDYVSFAFQGRAAFTPAARRMMLEAYLESAAAAGGAAVADTAQLPEVRLYRGLQVLGAYGLRGRMEGRPEFMGQASRMVTSLLELPADTLSRYPAITAALRAYTPEWTPSEAPSDAAPSGSREGLTVTVTSFSYRKGYPRDAGGNGGGFVFDCRAIHNPGRYDRYKPLTGRDAPVREFLEADGEIFPFLQEAYGLVDAAVDKYLRRGFTALSVAFGCTGGRHRSVYSAEAMAHHLAGRADVRVHLVHREQQWEQWL